MRILLYTGSALPKLGGQEAVVDALARQFQSLGHHPTVLAPLPRLPLRPNDTDLPYPVLRHPRFFSTKAFVGWYKFLLQRAAKKNKFDILHCHDTYPTGYVASLCCKKLNLPLIITSHGGDIRPNNARLSKPGMRPRFLQAIQAADALISISQFTKQAFLELNADEKKIHDIPNGVDLTPFQSPAPRPDDLDPNIQPNQYLLFLGRLSHRKGIDVLLKALALLPPTNTIELVIAGTGEEQPKIEKQIADLNLQPRVRLVGRVAGQTKTYLLQNAMCLVLPSRDWEAFPLVVLESFAAARPVIGSRIPGLQDTILEEKTGLLFDPESEQDLAQAITRFRDDPQLLTTTSTTAHQHAANFNWTKIATNHIRLYSEMT